MVCITTTAACVPDKPAPVPYSRPCLTFCLSCCTTRGHSCTTRLSGNACCMTVAAASSTATPAHFPTACPFALQSSLVVEFRRAIPAYDDIPRTQWIYKYSTQNTIVVTRTFFTQEVRHQRAGACAWPAHARGLNIACTWLEHAHGLNIACTRLEHAHGVHMHMACTCTWLQHCAHMAWTLHVPSSPRRCGTRRRPGPYLACTWPAHAHRIHMACTCTCEKSS